jgi:hypothetical protein
MRTYYALLGGPSPRTYPGAIAALLLAGLVLPAGVAPAAPANGLLLEAESFERFGGWVLDPQFMDQMGSPYLLAHGLGQPVADAQTTAKFAAPGTYRVWVRTRDWVAPWKAPGTPGRFQVLIDGKPLRPLFGTEGAPWHWQEGGTVQVGSQAQVALHDLTGFEGRCDAVFFCRDLNFQPPNAPKPLTAWRRQLLALPAEPQEGGQYDLVVVGGGIAGTCATLAAARLGLTVALVQDRPVLGGNNSSEVRVWLNGKVNLPPYPRIGDIVSELEPAKRAQTGPQNTAAIYEDDRRLALVRHQPGVTLFLENRVNAIQASNGIVRSVVAQNIRTARRLRLSGRWFADCTGDGVVGCLAKADYQETRRHHMGPSNLWNVQDTGQEQPFPPCACEDTNALNLSFTQNRQAAPFPRCPWAIDLHDKPFPGRRPQPGTGAKAPLESLGGWIWESGYERDPITEVEWMRDQNLRAMYGAWDTLKNVDKLYPNYQLNWAAYIAGKRESRRLLGDVVLDALDILTNRVFADGCFPCTWPVDVHTADPKFDKGPEGDEFISRSNIGAKKKYKGPYWAPYRCLYSRNVTNLFMAGRDISVTHTGLGAVRVMRTCGAMGEVVGMAASLCKQHSCEPRAVYEQHLDELKQLMRRGVGRSGK